LSKDFCRSISDSMAPAIYSHIAIYYDVRLRNASAGELLKPQLQRDATRLSYLVQVQLDTRRICCALLKMRCALPCLTQVAVQAGILVSWGYW
jgi:hypothetical protein